MITLIKLALILSNMKKLIKKQFGYTDIELIQLNGYDNANYLVKTETGKYVFKIYPRNDESLALVAAENETLLFLKDSKNFQYPIPVSFNDGSLIKVLEMDGKPTICRMLNFIEGQFLGEVVHTENMFISFATLLAKLDLKLQSFNNVTIKTRQWEWDIQYLYLNHKYLKDIASPNDRKLVNYFFQQFTENVAPALHQLRKSIIHNDANEWNVLVNNGQVTAIIDFGDLAYSPLVNELAVAIAYACFDKEKPLDWAVVMLNAYHKTLALEENEVRVLYYLIAARLCISVCNSAYSKKQNIENEYAQVSEKQAWELLYRWLRVNPIDAENRFRTAIGLKPLPVKSTNTILKQRHEVISPLISVSYSKPLNLNRSAFQYMYDVHGNTYLDAYNNIPHVGHSHPKVVEAGQRQMAKLNTNTRYLYDLLPEYAHQLLAKFPDTLDKVFFVNSGSEASDLAIRIARMHTGLNDIMVMEHGYHGHTQTDIDISDYKFSHKHGQGQKDLIVRADIPDTYRGVYTNNDGSAGKLYARDAIEKIAARSEPIAAFISEPIVGCGGQVPLATGYLKALYPEIRKQGGVCISDEVQTGFGRLGDYFWGFEVQEVVPDIVIIGKPMGNGHPIGAVITTGEIAESFSGGVEFFSSFGGNPISCAIGLSVLNVIEEEGLQENARLVGNYYKSLLRDLQNEFSCIGDVRGSGLFLGVELVKDQANKEPDTILAQHLKNELRNKHILISTDGPHDSVLKTKPPLCFTKADAVSVTQKLYDIIKKHAWQS